MKNSTLPPVILFFVLMMTFSPQNEAPGQTPTRTVPPTGPNPEKTNGPALPIRRIRDQVKVITKKEYIKVAVSPKANIGYLSVVAIPTATVTLTPVPDGRKKGTIKQIIKEQDGSLNLINIPPGKYKLLIEHEDYQPYHDDIQIEQATPDTYVALTRMQARYGTVHIGGVPQGAKVFWDEKAINLMNPKLNNQGIVLNKVPVGNHKLKVVKDSFLDYEKEIEVQPGKEAFDSVQLAAAIVSLILSSQPGARVNVDGEDKGVIPSDGKLAIQLLPGPRKIRVSKDGFQEWFRELTLARANNPVNHLASLVPVPISAEGNWEPANRESKWYPQNSGWIFNKTGALIKGDKPVLFDTELNLDFNHYQNVKIEFDVVFNNARGVAWVARAKDPDNYYLFEITGPMSGTPSLNFYICQDGKLQLKDSRSVVEKMDVRGDTFHIIFEARGNRFETRMDIRSAPSTEPHRIGIFQDNTFSSGGIGFRGRNLSETLLQTLFVFPL